MFSVGRHSSPLSGASGTVKASPHCGLSLQQSPYGAQFASQRHCSAEESSGLQCGKEEELQEEQAADSAPLADTVSARSTSGK